MKHAKEQAALTLSSKNMERAETDYRLSQQLIQGSQQIKECYPQILAVPVNGVWDEYFYPVDGFEIIRGTGPSEDIALGKIALKESHMGRFGTAMNITGQINSAFLRFSTYLNLAENPHLNFQKAHEAMERARMFKDEALPLDEKVRVLAWSAWIDRLLGRENSRLFEASKLALEHLGSKIADDKTERFDSPIYKRLRNYSFCASTLSQVAYRLERKPDQFLELAQKSARSISSWPDRIDAYTALISAQEITGADYYSSLQELKSGMDIDQPRVNDFVIQSWLKAARMERVLDGDWKKTAEYIRLLCSKISNPYQAALGYLAMAEFYLESGLDPLSSLNAARDFSKGIQGERKLKFAEHISRLENGLVSNTISHYSNMTELKNYQSMQSGFSPESASVKLVKIRKTHSDPRSRLLALLEHSFELARQGEDPRQLLQESLSIPLYPMETSAQLTALKIRYSGQLAIAQLLHQRATEPIDRKI